MQKNPLDIYHFETMFHGTVESDGHRILNGSIDVEVGGGELGRGFYCGNSYQNAQTWAFYKAGQVHDNSIVIAFRVAVDDFIPLDFEYLTDNIARQIYDYIKSESLGSTYLFYRNGVEAIVMGKEIENGRQYKWESSASENLLNSDKIAKRPFNDGRGYSAIYISWP